MKAMTGLTGVLLTLVLTGCAGTPAAPAPPQAAIPATLLGQLGEQVAWLKSGACRGDRAATQRLSRAMGGGGMGPGDFTWMRGQPREPLTPSGMLGGLHENLPGGLGTLSCGGLAAD